MFITGHVASALLASRRWTLDPRIAITAALFPDLVDKPAKFLGLVPTGRFPTHTLLALGLTTIVVLLVDRRFRRRGRWVAAWVTGYSLHLALDFADVVPLLWPFRAYPALHYPLIGQRAAPDELIVLSGVLELLLMVIAVYVEIRRRRRAPARESA
jgi:hypothetical protein